jgi:hypothetical protein
MPLPTLVLIVLSPAVLAPELSDTAGIGKVWMPSCRVVGGHCGGCRIADDGGTFSRVGPPVSDNLDSNVSVRPSFWSHDGQGRQGGFGAANVERKEPSMKVMRDRC